MNDWANGNALKKNERLGERDRGVARGKGSFVIGIFQHHFMYRRTPFVRRPSVHQLRALASNIKFAGCGIWPKRTSIVHIHLSRQSSAEGWGPEGLDHPLHNLISIWKAVNHVATHLCIIDLCLKSTYLLFVFSYPIITLAFSLSLLFFFLWLVFKRCPSFASFFLHAGRWLCLGYPVAMFMSCQGAAVR